MSEAPKIFTLKQVVSSIRKTLEERYQQTYWVKAEMHKLNKAASGHCFPELLQKEDGKIVAEIRSSIWKHNFDRINERFIKIVKEPLKEDTTLLLHVKVSFHEVYGLSLHIQDIDPNYALGELQRERQETLKKLNAEGVLNQNQQLKFPLLPKRIAIISAEGTKGLSDFMEILNNNDWGYRFFTHLFPASLQGDKAADTIVKQLRQIEKLQNHFDVAVIVRGGGGEVGLSCYNNYNLCRTIATFPIPILSGIGHSTNLTVAEMVSFRNAITPTELADFLLQAFHNFSIPLKDSVKTIKHQSNLILEREQARLLHLSQAYKHNTYNHLRATTNVLQRFGSNFKSTVKVALQEQGETLNLASQRLLNQTHSSIKVEKTNLLQIKKTLPSYLRSSLEHSKNRLKDLEHSVELMDPSNVLKRGFSITTINGKTVGFTNEVQKGDIITTRTATFTLESEVISKKDKNG